MKIAVTGATGYIGTHFVKMAQAQGHQIIFLSRIKPHHSECWISYNLNDEIPPTLTSDVDMLLHLAYQASTPKNTLRIDELESAKHILSAGKNVGAKIIFLSSQTANKESLSDYGRTKWEIEQLVISSGNIAIRPGLVYGGEPRGLFLGLLNTIQKYAYLPSFLPSPKIQPIHVQDLCKCLLKVMELENSPAKIFYFGEEKVISFNEFMQFLAKTYLNKKISFIPVPSLIILWCINPLKYFSPKASQLASLFTLPMMNTGDSLREIQYQLKPVLPTRPGKDPTTKVILREGFIIYSYITGQKPNLLSLRLYIRLIKSNRKNLSLQLPDFFSYYPLLLCAYDQSQDQNTWVKELIWRIQAASLLIEASPQGASNLIKTSHDSFIATGISLSLIVIKELFLRVLGAIVRSCITTLPPSSWRNNP
jgi:nucleoside-diphosphate-sugar epimerase